MNRLDLELKLKEIDSSSFQRLCDTLLTKQGYKLISYGNSEGKNGPRKGTPDTYIVNNANKTMVFVEYTVQNSGLNKKIIDDINKCFDKSEKLKEFSLKEILFFVNGNNVDPITIDKAVQMCSSRKINFKLYSQIDICELLYRYKSVIKDFFNETLDDDSALSIDDFIDVTKVLKGVNHSFEFVKRESDEQKIFDSINNNIITIVNGEAGVGKSMLAIQTLKKINGNIFCVRKSNENSLDYVIELSKKYENLFIFLDDVNEISSFNRFLESLSSKKLEKIKVICTIREYALSSIISIINNYSLSYAVIKINKLSDDSIKEILSKNLKIYDKRCLDRIAQISRGNPRLAIMAGNVALNGGIEQLIDSKTIMKKYFELSTNDTIRNLINEYHSVLGFVAFIKKVDINNLSLYKEILDVFSITEKDIKESIDILNSSEIISLYENSVIQIDDQNLSDYILEKNLIDLRCCKISELIIKLLNTKEKEIVESLNVILNIYSSESSRNYIRDEVLNAWDYLEKTKNFDNFINVFYSFNISKALLYFKNKIKNIYCLFSGNFENYEKIYGRNADVDTLTRIYKDYNNSSALQLLFLCLDYNVIREYAYDVLKTIATLEVKNFTKDGILNDAPFMLKDYKDKPWFDYLLFSVLDEGLKFSYEFVNMTDRRTITYGRLELKDEYLGISSYRNKLWELSFLLSDDKKYKLIFSFKNKYPSEDCNKIFLEDIKMINKLLKSIKSRDVLKEELYKINMLEILRKLGISSDELQIFAEDDLKSLILIFNPIDRHLTYEENKSNHSKAVHEYGNNASINDIKEILYLCNKIDKVLCDNNYRIIKFLNLLIYDMPIDKLNILLAEIQFDTISCNIKCILLDANYKAGNKEECLKYLYNIDNDADMIEATFYIFCRIDEKDVNDEIRNHFLKCFVKDLSIKNSNRRRMDSLYKFSKSENEFVNHICLLMTIKEENETKFFSWLELLFNKFCFDPNVLIPMFYKNGKIKELEDIILCVAYTKKYEYDLNKYVYATIKYDKSFINIIVDRLLDYKENINYEILSGLWEQENAFELADIIFNKIVQSKKLLFIVPFSIENIFISKQSKTYSNNEFLTWAINKAKKVCTDKSIKILTQLVSKCSDELAYQYYTILVEKQIDVNLFKDILHYPSSNFWSGSEVNVYITKINKFKNIIDLIPKDLKYLEYRAILEDYIVQLESSIKHIRIREKIEFDDELD